MTYHVFGGTLDLAQSINLIYISHRRTDRYIFVKDNLTKRNCDNGVLSNVCPSVYPSIYPSI